MKPSQVILTLYCASLVQLIEETPNKIKKQRIFTTLNEQLKYALENDDTATYKMSPSIGELQLKGALLTFFEQNWSQVVPLFDKLTEDGILGWAASSNTSKIAQQGR